MEKYLECVEGNSAKFWQIKVTGSKTHISYGKIGSAGQSQEKDHGSAAAATKFAEKMIKEKEKKGYSEASAGTKREAPAAARSGGARRGRGGARGGGRGSKRAKKEESEEEEEEEDEDEKPAGPVLWRVALTESKTSIFAIYVNDKAVYAGDEDGNVVELNHNGKLQRAFKLPTGVKCVVGDGPFLYAGCNNGSLYDLTSGVPRLMCNLEAFSEVYWMDIKHGMLAAADASGSVALVNGEGETIWSKKDKAGHGGWMCRMDDTGVYHGHSDGVVKYDLTGKQLWEQRDAQVHGIMFGCQDADHVYPAGSNVVKLDKKTGAIKHVYEASNPPSNAVSADGKWVIPTSPFICYEGATGKTAWEFDQPACFLSMAFYGTDRVFGVDETVVCYDVTPAAVAKATQGKHKIPPVHNLKIADSDAIAPSETVETTTDTSKGILCECVKEGSKLRVRVTHKGYDPYGSIYSFVTWNVQFPQAIREAGAKYIVEQILESKQGGFYRALGDIKKLAK